MGIIDVPLPARAADAAESLAALLKRIEALMAAEDAQARDRKALPIGHGAAEEPFDRPTDRGAIPPRESASIDAGSPDDTGPADPVQAADGEGPFRIADVVARIDAFRREHERPGGEPRQEPPVRAQRFRFETDSSATIRWVEGVNRGPLIGLALGQDRLRVAAPLQDVHITVGGDSDAVGDWLISALPAFDAVTGRFTGYRGTARRPRRAASAATMPDPSATQMDSLRQLVHELRTPANAIAGFAEMIETQMLGAVADPYRRRAAAIRSEARDLIGAIDDLDLAARIDGGALSLVAAPVRLRPLLKAAVEDLAPLLLLRGSAIRVQGEDAAVSGDRRAIERLVARLMATLVSASGRGEQIGVRIAAAEDGRVVVTIDRPVELAYHCRNGRPKLDEEPGDTALLGTGFALRLGHDLARELGGSLSLDADRVILSLPAARRSDDDAGGPGRT